MVNKEKRILWLLNHTTLRAFEVPLLISLGYEVFTPKYIPHEVANYSGSEDYTYDKTLTLPKEVLEQLNQFDFYEGIMTKPFIKLLNKYFSSVFCLFQIGLLEQLVRNFEGRILLRAFGLDHTRTYSQLIHLVCGNVLLQQIQSLGNRFWFSQCYPQLQEVESPILQSRAITHPLGLPDKFFAKKDTWVGGVKKILFFCSRIALSDYYYNIYIQFKNNFGDLPYTVAGNQPIPVEDWNVAGYQSRATIDEWLQTYDVMFYHSEEPRHLHYHPLEAIAFGMPLIYMKKGLLGRILEEEQPGACSTYQEAHEKIQRVLNGDKTFIQTIKQHQAKILHTFTWEYCRQDWEKSFVQTVMAIVPTPPPKKTVKKIAIFLPLENPGGILQQAMNLAKMIYLGSRQHNEPVEVVFCCIANTYNVKKDFKELIELGITVRETHWNILSRQEILWHYQLKGDTRERIDPGMVSHVPQTALRYPNYVYPYDGYLNFMDCDFWLLISDRTSEPLAPLKPYGVVVYDYIQRYVPQIFGETYERGFLSTVRGANFILTTTTGTREDAIQYAGVPEERVHMLPMEFNPFYVKPKPSPVKKDYFIWTTNTSPHKNHLNAIEGLAIYYNDLQGKLDVVMTGPQTNFYTDLTLQDAELQKVRDAISRHACVKKRLSILGELDTPHYVSVLAGAKFLWHPTLKDNGTYSVVEAAYYGVPALSANYPQMRFINERFGLNLSFFSADEPEDIANQLKKMEESYLLQTKKLPSKAMLDEFTYKKLASESWLLLKDLL